MRKDFKRAGYFLTTLFFLLGLAALIIGSGLKFFSFDKDVVIIARIVSLIAMLILGFTCFSAKRSYNYVCTKFADYIISSRKKEAEHQEDDAQRVREIQEMRAAAERDRENAVAAALEQGRTEGASAAAASAPAPSYAPPVNYGASVPTAPTAPSAPAVSAQRPAYPQPAASGYMQPITPGDEVLYNEYGEPVMIRRRVRRASAAAAEVLYDRYGNPVPRPAQPTNSAMQ